MGVSGGRLPVAAGWDDPYPEVLEHDAPGWPDRLAIHAKLWWRQQRRQLMAGPMEAAAGRVQRRAARLARLDERAFEAEIGRQRQALRRNGLDGRSLEATLGLVNALATRCIGLTAYSVQLQGSLGLLNGLLIEMDTGEGKTLTAGLAAVSAAFAGVPVHVFTTNDYLAERDSAFVAPIASALGLTRGLVLEGMSEADRRAAYRADIVFGTGKQIVFDYLRDRLSLQRSASALHWAARQLEADQQTGAREPLLRGLHMAIVDEADSILVDEARTPLVLSRKSSNLEAAELAADAVRLAGQLEIGRDAVLLNTERRLALTAAGRARLETLAADAGPLLRGRRRREEVVEQALVALHLLRRGHEYVVHEDKVQIVDEFTGRILADRTWSAGLHQMIEAKEGCSPSAATDTLAQITYQRFFRRYRHLSGMTGTAREVEAELWSVYGLAMMRIPPRRRNRRIVRPARVFASRERKLARICARVAEHHRQRRPVLVGVRTIDACADLSRRLSEIGIAHEMLNAINHAREAEIVAAAGEPGRVTIATNMAGRGTDIKLGPGVAEAGGLVVVLTERHEAGRIDRQLIGRCARQGDRGLAEIYLSLEDDLVARSGYARAGRALAAGMTVSAWPFQPLARWIVDLAQREQEHRNAQAREACVEQDRRLAEMLAFAGAPE